MDRLLPFRPPKPDAARDRAAPGATADGDVLWRASAAPGLLAALPDGDGGQKKRRAGLAVAVRSAARPIPEKTAAAALAPPAPVAAARSAPVRIPSEAAAPRRERWAHSSGRGGGGGEAMVPPHEIVARRAAAAAAAHSSVLEGTGRTLKGRDLHRVRNAVLRRTGFLD